jgi:flavin-dependent dehydrogenase
LTEGNESRLAADQHFDVVIIGAGLAGLCLARQLKRARPQTSILVLERNRYPVPEAAYKVGESTSELGAYYFRDVLGLSEHLEREQLRKSGLRFYYTRNGNQDMAERFEVGAPAYLATRTTQLDRGRLENFLAGDVRGLGVEVREEVRVTDLEIGRRSEPGSNRVRIGGADPQEISCRWLVDAGGRQGMIKRKLGLGRKIDHDCNSVWFRIGRKMDVQDWSADEDWKDRFAEPELRWRATSHLMGTGYWFWVIPLGVHATSFGIVADPECHPFERINTFEKALGWLREHEPRAAAEIERERDALLDFRVLRHFASGCERVFSDDRWAIVGDAGFFLDPLYSVGSDFIALANTFIVDSAVRDLDGELGWEQRLNLAHELHLLYAEIMLNFFRYQYPLMGDSEVMSAKTFWDVMQYWAMLALPYFRGSFLEDGFIDWFLPRLRKVQVLNNGIQQLAREWRDLNLRRGKAQPYQLTFQQGLLPTFFAYNANLLTPMDSAEVRAKVDENLEFLEGFAATIYRTAAGLDDEAAVDPYAIPSLATA